MAGAPLPRGATPFAQLVDLMATLRGQQGCPWDREQSHQSLTPYLIEEAYEALECIEDGDLPRLREELGDLLLQIVFHAQLASEQGLFTADDVTAAIVAKMVRRHPHVFGEAEARTPADVVQQWEQIKLQEKAEQARQRRSEDADAEAASKPSRHPDDHAAQPSFVSLMEGIPRNLPALLAAERITGRAAEVGFEWDGPAQALAKVHEECDELLRAWEGGDGMEVREEMGDLLFALANVARMMGMVSEDALRLANQKFVRRFQHIERDAHRRGVPVASLPTPEQLTLWEESKTATRTPGQP